MRQIRMALVVLGIIGGSWSRPGRAQTMGPPAVLDRLAVTAGAPLRSRVSPATGLATFIAADPAHPIPLTVPLAASAEQRARAFLLTAGAAVGIALPDDAAATSVRGPDGVGIEHVRMQQLHRGVPVRGGELVVHLRGANVVAVNARTLADLTNVATTPAIDAAAATKAVRVQFAGDPKLAAATIDAPRLEVMDPGHFDQRPGVARLTWAMEARGPGVRERVWVDAQTGAIIQHFSQLTDARDRRVHDAQGTSSLPGVLVRSEGADETGDIDADLAYTYTGDTYDYFAMEHGRDSYDDAGAPLVSTVHFCDFACPFANAFWDGAQMVFGDGFSAADDVVAHELTHAVTERSANLVYCLQSGALNESFSDMFGETVDLSNAGGTDDAASRWLLGEDVPGFGAIRNMAMPNAFGHPARVGDPFFFCASSCFDFDNGGVHINSGVPNHAYALMVDGGTFNGVSVTGIGLAKTGRVQYRALTEYLTAVSSFNDYYDVVQQACSDLVGTAGITADDCTQVRSALDAVELGATVCPNLAVCGNGVVEPGEQCDDGNLTNGDGCSANCFDECLRFNAFVSQPIPQSGSIVSTLSLPIPGDIASLSVVGLVGSHPDMGDLRFTVSNGGRGVAVLDRACPGEVGFNLGLADGAASGPCPPSDGLVHRPSRPLSSFRGTPIGGLWKLTVANVAGRSAGILGGWGLRICANHCGDGFLNPGEGCDDGNTTPGDGCSAACKLESCQTLTRITLRASRLLPPAGDDTLTLSGRLQLPFPIRPPVDPEARGLHLRILDATGGVVLDAPFPAGAYTAGQGWRHNAGRTKWTFVAVNGIQGITKVTVLDRSLRAPGEIELKVSGRRGSFAVAPEQLPLGVTFVINPVGQCARATLPGDASCTQDVEAGTLRCS